MRLNCCVGEDSWESLGLQGDPASPSWRRSVLGVHWKDWCWSWNSNTLATWCEELTHMKRPWCWERLRAGGEGDDRQWDGWMASPTRWTWVWVDSGSWWWTGRPGVLRFMGSQRVGHDWATELNWTPHICLLPNSQNLWSYYLNGKRDFADVIKDLDREFGISAWTQCNHKCPLRVEEVSRRVWEIEDVMVLALKMKKRVMSPGMQTASRN